MQEYERRASDPSSTLVGLLASVLFAVAGGCSTDENGNADGTQNDGGMNATSSGSGSSGSGNGSFQNLTPEQEAALNACEAETGQRTFIGCPVDVLCSSLTADNVVPVQVTFEPLTEECPWTDKDDLDGPSDRDNLSLVDEETRARVEQIRDLKPQLSVPEGEAAVFCSVDISVRSLREDGQFRYDDDILFLFGGNTSSSGAEGGALLITRNASMPGAMLEPVPDLTGVSWPLYDWSDIAGLEISNDNDALFCLDIPTVDPDNPQCGLPPTQEDGRFFIDLDDQTASRLGIRAALTDNYNLTVVMTGDNNPSSDCQHDGFEATVNVGYILVPQAALPELL